MKKAISLSCAVLILTGAAFVVSGCGIVLGSGRTSRETRAADGFTGVSLRGTGTAVIAFGEKEEVRIEAEDNLIPYLETKVENETLDIGVRRGTWIQPTKPVKFFVTMKSLEALTLGGSGRIEAPDFKTGRLRADVGGSGEIALSVVEAAQIDLSVSGSGVLGAAGMRSPEAVLRVSGSGKINLAEWKSDRAIVEISGSGAVTADGGAVADQRISVSGSGAYRTGGVKGADADVSVSGSGSVDVRVERKLSVKVSGSGSVRYAGRPEVTTSISGSGKVEPAGD